MPYYCYWKCVVTGRTGRKGFSSRQAMDRFASSTPASVRITHHN